MSDLRSMNEKGKRTFGPVLWVVLLVGIAIVAVAFFKFALDLVAGLAGLALVVVIVLLLWWWIGKPRA